MSDWLDMGTVTPSYNEWRLFPSPSIAGQTFKLRFNGISAYEFFFRTLVAIRPVYIVSGEEIVPGSGRRFWPKADSPEIITTWSIPPEFEARGINARIFEVKKFLKRPYIGRSGEPNYSLTMFDYVYNETPIPLVGGGEYGP